MNTFFTEQNFYAIPNLCIHNFLTLYILVWKFDFNGPNQDCL